MLKVAITGNIASGKSQVEKIIGKYYPVYDADKIAHSFLGVNRGVNSPEARAELGKKVFANPELRKQLEAEIHPKVKAEIERIFGVNEEISTPHPYPLLLGKEVQFSCEALEPSPARRVRVGDNFSNQIIFISVPLLFEAKFDSMFDKIIFVSCDEKTRLERLMKRNNLTQEEALNRIKSQQAEEEKIKKSDFVIYNNSSLEELENQVNLVLANIINTHNS